MGSMQMGSSSSKMSSSSVSSFSGCLFGEFLQMKPLFQGRSEYQQLTLIFQLLGVPTLRTWPGYKDLPLSAKMKFEGPELSQLRKKYKILTSLGFELLDRLLKYAPERRMTCAQALAHPYFTESPLPIDASMFPMWPAKSESGDKVRSKFDAATPPAPAPGGRLADEDAASNFSMQNPVQQGGGFQLKF